MDKRCSRNRSVHYTGEQKEIMPLMALVQGYQLALGVKFQSKNPPKQS